MNNAHRPLPQLEDIRIKKSLRLANATTAGFRIPGDRRSQRDAGGGLWGAGRMTEDVVGAYMALLPKCRYLIARRLGVIEP